MSILLVSELFGPTIQGEGKYTGVPSVFLRLHGCNLVCHFRNGTCDTPYTSINPEKPTSRGTKELADELMDLLYPENRRPRHLVITGGEPLIQQEALIELIDHIYSRHSEFSTPVRWPKITIETNGSIVPATQLLAWPIYWSVSPKLSNSCCFEGSDLSFARQEAHIKHRINQEALSKILMTSAYQFKFVYSDPSAIQEIQELMKGVCEYATKNFGPDIVWPADLSSHIYIMPEGASRDQLALTSESAAQAAIENGYNYCDRTHIRIWDIKRKV